jgi:hypothetical protein
VSARMIGMTATETPETPEPKPASKRHPAAKAVRATAGTAASAVKTPVNAARALMPDKPTAVVYGALGAVAALEIVAWPLAAAVAAGWAGAKWWGNRQAGD